MAFIYDDFAKWLDGVFEKEIPDDVVALSFNIYEEWSDRMDWSVVVVGTSSFDKDDQDWACDETTDFGTRDNLFWWIKSTEDTTYENVEREVEEALLRYLEVGRHADKLKALRGVGTGFVDDALHLVYVKE